MEAASILVGYSLPIETKNKGHTFHTELCCVFMKVVKASTMEHFSRK